MILRPSIRAALLLMLGATTLLAQEASENAAAAPEQPTSDYALTVYPVTASGKQAVIRQRFTQDLGAGQNTLELTSIPRTLIPTSVTVKSENGEVQLLESRLDYGLPSPTAMLQSYIGREVLINRRLGAEARTETVRGKLVSFDDDFFTITTTNRQLPLQLVPRTPDLLEIKLFNPGPLPATSAMLVLKLQARNAGPHRLDLTYQSSGLHWSADYTLMLRDENKAELTGLATLHSQKGQEIAGARVTLAHGDGKAAVSLDRAVALPANGSVQPALFAPLRDVSYSQDNIFYTGGKPGAAGVANNTPTRWDVEQYFTLDLNEKSGAAILPGDWRILRHNGADAAPGAVAFLRNVTPIDGEPIRLPIGRVDGLSGSQLRTIRRVEGSLADGQHVRLEFRNESPEDQTIQVIETARTPSIVMENSQPFNHEKGRIFRFTVNVPAGKSRELTYVLRPEK